MPFPSSLGGISHIHSLLAIHDLGTGPDCNGRVHLHALSYLIHPGPYQFWSKFNHITILLKIPGSLGAALCDDWICVLSAVFHVSRQTCLHHNVCDTQGSCMEEDGKTLGMSFDLCVRLARGRI